MSESTIRGGPCLPVGATLGAYVVEGLLGSGRFASVYRVRDPQAPGQNAAAKVTWSGERERLAAQAAALRRLDHPHVPRLLGVELASETPCLFLELVAGTTLRRRLVEAGPLGFEAAVALIHALADALGHAHARGVIHGDLKPENVLLDAEGRAHLIDFGGAEDAAVEEPSGVHLSRDLASVTGSHGLAFDPAYAPPEVLGRQSPTPRSDVYSLGAVLFECLTGERPQHGELLSARRPDAPPALVDMIARCLGRPAGRFADGGELRDALAPLLERLAPARPAAGVVQPAPVPAEDGENDGTCPSCRRPVPPGASVCPQPQCGLNLSRRRPALAHLGRAERALHEGRWSDAARAAELALAVDPQVPRAAMVRREAVEQRDRVALLGERAQQAESLELHATAALLLSSLESASPAGVPAAAQELPAIRARAAARRCWREGLAAWRARRLDDAKAAFVRACERDPTLEVRQLAALTTGEHVQARAALLEAFDRQIADDRAAGVENEVAVEEAREEGASAPEGARASPVADDLVDDLTFRLEAFRQQVFLRFVGGGRVPAPATLDLDELLEDNGGYYWGTRAELEDQVTDLEGELRECMCTAEEVVASRGPLPFRTEVLLCLAEGHFAFYFQQGPLAPRLAVTRRCYGRAAELCERAERTVGGDEITALRQRRARYLFFDAEALRRLGEEDDVDGLRAAYRRYGEVIELDPSGELRAAAEEVRAPFDGLVPARKR